MGFLYSLVILPLESVIETLFYFSDRNFGLFDYGGAIIFVSLSVNLLILPIYNAADARQLGERELRKRIDRGVTHIKATFSGDERFLMLSEYYRQNHYSPLSTLRSSLSILIQIPFFIAAYHFLSNCEDLVGESFFFIQDLSLPDGILRFAGRRVNVLPLLMTLTNVLSGAVYSRNAPLREKIQIYALALLFLLLLYNSPSGIVFYWLFNNLFSLCKNIAQKCLRRPSAVLFILLDVIAAVTAGYTFFIKTALVLSKKFVVYAVCLAVFCLPVFVRKFLCFLNEREKDFSAMEKSVIRPLFLLSAVCLAFLAGLALPSAMIASSPEDFSFSGGSSHPLHYVVSSIILMMGLFVLWPSLFYFVVSSVGRACLSLIFFVAAVFAVLNAFVFKSDYGLVSVTGVLDSERGLRGIHPFQLLLPVLALVLLILLVFLLCRKRKIFILSRIMAVVCLALLSFSIVNCVRIRGRFNEYARVKNEAPHSDLDEGNSVFTLTTSGRNVIVIFLDKAIGTFVPYAMQDFPVLKDMYAGFTYYRNTVSFADHTVKGAPALYGGYEYTPEEINRRGSELLLDKHNEALLVVPKIFSEAGWRVTDLDPPWMNYTLEDLSPFEQYPAISAMNVKGLMTGKYNREHKEDSLGAGAEGVDQNIRAAVPRFCLMQMLYPPLREVYYHSGDYYHRVNGNPNYIEFIDSYANLCYLNELTSIDDGPDCYLLMENETTHDNVFMKGDETKGLKPVNEILDSPSDLTLSYNWHEEDSCYDLQLYEVNCAALLRLGEWFDFLKQNGVWDNSRIILVSDHGVSVVRPFAPGFSDNRDYSSYAALLMVKDFGSSGEFAISTDFMTNADVPLISMEGLGLADSNPFTGRSFFINKDDGVNVYIRNSDVDAADLRKKKEFDLALGGSYHVHDDIYVESNWIPLAEWKRMEGEGGH